MSIKNKQDVYLIFSDVDNTLVPASNKDFEDFCKLIKHIENKDKIKIKLFPISGRTSYFLSNKINELNECFKTYGVNDLIRYGAGEQGLVYSFPDSGKNSPNFKIDSEYKINLYKKLNNQKFYDEMQKESETLVIDIFKVKEDAMKDVATEQRKEVFSQKITKLKNYIDTEFGNKFDTAKFCNDEVGVLEVTPKGMSKDYAIKKIYENESRNSNIVGMSYCGDAENDMKAIDYMARLAQIPKIYVSVFTPKNAFNVTDSPKYFVSQRGKNKYLNDNVIIKGNFDTLKGITDAIKRRYLKRELHIKQEGVKISNKPVLRRTKSDSNLIFRE